MDFTKKGDEQIINDILLEDNKKSYDYLYGKYKKIIKSYILKKFGDYNEIDDDVSEILIKGFLNLYKFDSTKSKFKSWLFTIAKNFLIDKWRCNKNNHLKNNHNIVYSTMLNNCSNEYNYIEDEFASVSGTINLENNDSLSHIYDNISTSDSTLLNMKYVEGYTYDEIGKEFNISSVTASNKINYVKAKIKKKFFYEM